jgi:NADH-quinone oxidoreductase subunit F
MRSTTTTSAIEVRELTKTYPAGVEAVKGIDFDVAAGEVFGLLGPNGAGKSTTVGMLTTAIAPTSGQARLAAPVIDQTVAEPASRHRPGRHRHLRLLAPVAAPDIRRPPDGARRVLDETVLSSLDAYRAVGGLRGLVAANEMSPQELVAIVLDSGLSGRGGAGFPSGRKWQTVADNALAGPPATVVVNGAEGEPGTFKDRSILRRDPYQVIEGAFIAARAVHADRVIIALKRSFTAEVARTRAALSEMRAANVLPASVEGFVFEGPDEYLYGEESALLETIDGRGPFPRVVPPYRVGLLGDEPHRRVGAGPALVNNVETIANVPNIVAHGAQWFRSIGTAGSPGTVVSTVTGDLHRHGVGEVAMGAPLWHVLETIGGGPVGPVKAVLSGVANPVIRGDQLDVPVSHEGMRGIGCGLGSAGFIVFAHPTDMVAVAAGVARFLAVESCGQCTPCKLDGIDLATLLDRVARSNATAADLEMIEQRIGTVGYGGRCYLAAQQETVLGSIFNEFRHEFDAHVTGVAPPVAPALIAELLDIRDGRAIVDEHHRHKQPDWTYRATSSGSTPVELRSRYASAPTR